MTILKYKVKVILVKVGIAKKKKKFDILLKSSKILLPDFKQADEAYNDIVKTLRANYGLGDLNAKD